MRVPSGKLKKWAGGTDGATALNSRVYAWKTQVDQELYVRGLLSTGKNAMLTVAGMKKSGFLAVETPIFPETENMPPFSSYASDCFDDFDECDFCSVVSSNETMSDIPGPGRTMGLALYRLGRSLERKLSKWLKEGRDPNVIAETLRKCYGTQQPKKAFKMLKFCKKLKYCILYVELFCLSPLLLIALFVSAEMVFQRVNCWPWRVSPPWR